VPPSAARACGQKGGSYQSRGRGCNVRAEDRGCLGRRWARRKSTYRVLSRYCLKALAPTGALVRRCNKNGWPLPRRCWAHRRARSGDGGPGGGGPGGTDPAHPPAVEAEPAGLQAGCTGSGEGGTPRVARVAEDAGADARPEAPEPTAKGGGSSRRPAQLGTTKPRRPSALSQAAPFWTVQVGSPKRDRGRRLANHRRANSEVRRRGGAHEDILLGRGPDILRALPRCPRAGGAPRVAPTLPRCAPGIPRACPHLGAERSRRRMPVPAGSGADLRRMGQPCRPSCGVNSAQISRSGASPLRNISPA